MKYHCEWDFSGDCNRTKKSCTWKGKNEGYLKCSKYVYWKEISKKYLVGKSNERKPSRASAGGVAYWVKTAKGKRQFKA